MNEPPPILYTDANDHNKVALAHAAENFKQLSGKWCPCDSPGEEVYYRDPNSNNHGWMCSTCRGIVQTG
jgi:hypothetical protein